MADTRPPRNVFISYARRDGDVARRIADALNSLGDQVFLDLDAIRPGDSFQKSIDDAISRASALVVIVTPSYFESAWCLREMELAAEKGRPIIPVLVSGHVSKSPLHYLNHLDYASLGGTEHEKAQRAASLIKQSVEALSSRRESNELDAGTAMEPGGKGA